MNLIGAYQLRHRMQLWIFLGFAGLYCLEIIVVIRKKAMTNKNLVVFLGSSQKPPIRLFLSSLIRCSLEELSSNTMCSLNEADFN
jgi:hypothetical protein